MLFWIGLVVGTVIGFLIKTLYKHSKPVGTICVYENDEDGGEPYMFLLLEQDVRNLLDKKRVVLKTEKRDNPARK